MSQRAQDLAAAYLAALNAGDLAAVLSLFAPEAQVVSPVYGTMDARSFYARLFGDTERSDTRLIRVLSAPDGTFALHFAYDWTLAGGELVRFEVVDIVETAGSEGGEKITKLTILYDTAPIRQAHARATGAAD